MVVLDDFQRIARDAADWSSLGCDVEFVHDHVADTDALAARLAGAAIVCPMRERTRFPAALLARLPALELVAATGSAKGQAYIDRDAATAAGIAIAVTGSGDDDLPSSTAELTLALMLAVARRITASERALRAGTWQPYVGTRLAGKVLGIVGLGRLGAEVAQLARAFGMRVIAWSPSLTPARAEAAGARAVSRDALFRDADFVSLHVRLTPATTHLVAAREFAAMKRGAFLINTSRGPVVDEQALLAALADGTLAGAGLDVFTHEPLPAAHPLAAFDNVVLTPHIGFVVDDAMRAFYRGDVANIAAWLAGTPRQLINPDAMAVARPRTALGLATAR
ncbi:MAG: D-2-hydroxyacid dehydrogenase family protein [Proteobacteria bacterium]|nr:D-2-hydroxyacid dehydrogenase family protein [Pseudomonadota bacterium]